MFENKSKNNGSHKYQNALAKWGMCLLALFYFTKNIKISSFIRVPIIKQRGNAMSENNSIRIYHRSRETRGVIEI